MTKQTAADLAGILDRHRDRRLAEDAARTARLAVAAGIPASRYAMELAAARADLAAYNDTSRPVRCSRCGSRMPADRSCDCFDNNSQ